MGKTKFVKFINLFILSAAGLLFFVATLLTMEQLPRAFSYKSAAGFVKTMAVALVAVGAVAGVSALLCRIRAYEKKWVWLVLALIIPTLQLLFYFLYEPFAVFDTHAVLHESARQVIENDFHIASSGGYFDRYGNNYPVALFFAVYYKILYTLGITDVWTWSVLLNIVMTDAAIFLLCRCLYLLRGKRAAFLLLLFCLFNPTTYVYMGYVYTSPMSVFWVALLVYQLVTLHKALQHHSQTRFLVLRGVGLGLTAIVSMLFRATNLIVVIAGVIVLVLLLLKNKTLLGKPLLCVALSALLAFVAVYGGYKAFESQYVSEEIRAKNFPAVHWIAMGLNENTNGHYYVQDVRDTRAQETIEEKTAMNVQKISTRLQEHGVVGLAQLFRVKLTFLWGGTYDFFCDRLQTSASHGFVYDWIAGKHSHYLIAYNQLYTIAMFLLLVWGCLKNLRRNNTLQGFSCLLLLCLLGVTLFHLFWEASYLYTIQMFPLILVFNAAHLQGVTVQKSQLRPLTLSLAGVLTALLVLANPLGSYKTDLQTDYSITSNRRRTHMEMALTGVTQLQQSFLVRPGQEIDRIMLLMTKRTEEQPYTVSLYRADGTFLEETTLTRTAKKEHYETVAFENVYGAGEYYFIIASADGEPFDPSFRYLNNLLADFNPHGSLTIDGDNGTGHWDLIFNVCLAKGK